MRLSRRTIGVVVAFSMVLAAVAVSAQERKGRGGFGGGFGAGDLVTTAANEDVQKDVGVSGDLASKIKSLSEDMAAARRKEYQTAGINVQDFRNITNEQRQKMTEINTKLATEFSAKVKELVSADQYKRLEQIQLQSGLRFGPGVLTYPNTAKVLELADDQKQKLMTLTREFTEKQRDLFTGGNFDAAAAAKLREEYTNKALDILSAAQKERLNALKGPAFDVSKLGGFGGRRGKGN